MQTITKEQFEAAKYSAAKLKPLADALAAIDDQALGYNAEAIQKLNDFCDFTSLKLLEASKIIARAHQAYADRDQDLILAAITRYHRIDEDVAAAKHQQACLTNLYKSKVDELKKQQFSDAEIEKIVARPDEEIAALETVIDGLASEKLRVRKFLADAPRYDASILVGTRVHELHEANRALGISATKV